MQYWVVPKLVSIQTVLSFYNRGSIQNRFLLESIKNIK